MNDENSFYKAEKCHKFEQQLGVEKISTASPQTTLKKLERQELISKQADNTLILTTLCQNWLNKKLSEH